MRRCSHIAHLSLHLGWSCTPLFAHSNMLSIHMCPTGFFPSGDCIQSLVQNILISFSIHPSLRMFLRNTSHVLAMSAYGKFPSACSNIQRIALPRSGSGVSAMRLVIQVSPGSVSVERYEKRVGMAKYCQNPWGSCSEEVGIPLLRKPARVPGVLSIVFSPCWCNFHGCR